MNSKTMKNASLPVFVVLLALQSPLLAEAHKWEVGLMGGASINVSSMEPDTFGFKSSDPYGNSPYAGAYGLFGLRPSIDAGLDVGYTIGDRLSYSGTDSGGSAAEVDSDVKRKVFHITPVIRMGPAVTVAGLRVRPYIIAGIGWYRMFANDGTIRTTITSGSGTTHSASIPYSGYTTDRFGVNGGIGFNINLTERLLVGAEARYHRFFNGHTTFLPSNLDFEFVIPTGKIGYLF